MEIDRVQKEIAPRFAFEGQLVECIPFGSGHINDTYRLTCQTEGGEQHYMLQRMNHGVFGDLAALMENVSGVITWLRKKIIANGGDEKRETLNLVYTREGDSFIQDAEGEYWRAFLLIEQARTYDRVEDPEIFYQSALAFGRFQRMLSDYPAATLHETIPDFHNTVDRLSKFEAALKADSCGRAARVAAETRFVLERRDLAHALSDRLADGSLPLRVTHNDTKLNNVMIDDQTGQAICVIDLDTVMPGLSAYDFGDSIRFGANTAAEDERDLSLVSCNMELFELYVKGYLEGCAGALTPDELDALPLGALLMTFECGMRFLTDYLEGDHYFKIHREGHNLDRARSQLALLADMEKKLPLMQEIVGRYR
ncbi:MAG: aminoglycoside phosphotransferase family protein [Lachnospiraceae bacterium]|nr:aminoglycoside phosphotransferase family protein [Lachnospiraceae bacterium]